MSKAKLVKYKLVIIIGGDLQEQFEIIKQQIGSNPKLKSSTLLLPEDKSGGKVKKLIEENQNKIKGHVDKETITIVFGHGRNDDQDKEKIHYTSGDPTSAINYLLEDLGCCNIGYFGCHIGTFLKEEKRKQKELELKKKEEKSKNIIEKKEPEKGRERQPGIIFNFGNSKNPTFYLVSIRTLTNIIELVENDINSGNKTDPKFIFKKAARNNPYTIYYRNEKGKTIKSSRLGKFKIEEIEKIFKSIIKEDREIELYINLEEVVKALKATFKEDFSSNHIFRTIKKLLLPESKIKDNEKSPSKIRSVLINKLITKFMEAVKEKLTSAEIVKYLNNRFREDDEKSPDKTSYRIMGQKFMAIFKKTISTPEKPYINVHDIRYDLFYIASCFYTFEDILKVLIADENIDINHLYNNGQTALISAVQNGQGYTIMAKMLIDAKADVNIRDRDGLTALMHAVSKDYIEIVQMLIEGKADVNIKDQDGFTALIHAVNTDNKEIVKMLIEGKADVNMKDGSGFTALIHAVNGDNKEMVQMLIDNKADINMKDQYGLTALMYAVNGDNKEMVQMLIDNKADIGKTLLLAADKGHTEIAEILIDKKTNINLKNIAGTTAIQIALAKQNDQLAKLLIESGVHLTSEMLNIAQTNNSKVVSTIKQILIYAGEAGKIMDDCFTLQGSFAPGKQKIVEGYQEFAAAAPDLIKKIKEAGHEKYIRSVFYTKLDLAEVTKMAIGYQLVELLTFLKENDLIDLALAKQNQISDWAENKDSKQDSDQEKVIRKILHDQIESDNQKYQNKYNKPKQEIITEEKKNREKKEEKNNIQDIPDSSPENSSISSININTGEDHEK